MVSISCDGCVKVPIMPPTHHISVMPGSLSDDSADESGVSAQLYTHSPHGSVHLIHLHELAQTVQTANILFVEEEGPGSPIEIEACSQSASTPRLSSPHNSVECSQHAAPFLESHTHALSIERWWSAQGLACRKGRVGDL